ncbi:MAG: 4Fe-4S binding protein [Anaerolineales bacterium]|nr:4Fe-4S binding protein [Anaerolineales bacterium]
MKFWTRKTRPVPPLLKRSTRALIKEARRTASFSFWDFLHGYIYGRWPYLYIGLGVGEHPAIKLWARIRPVLERVLPGASSAQSTSSRSVADGYHGKVITTESAKQLLSIREPVELRNLEKIIPYPVARDILLIDPDHLVVLECPCRSARENPCSPLDVCLIVGEPFASFVAEHHPERSRWIDIDEGMQILDGEARRGHVHHAFFKDAMLGRFYAICNCCSCCCGAMQSVRNGTPMLASSGYASVLDTDLCSACGLCEDTCPFSAIVFEGDYPEILFEACTGCGVCVRHCPEGALNLVLDSRKGVPLEMETLLNSGGHLS